MGKRIKLILLGLAITAGTLSLNYVYAADPPPPPTGGGSGGHNLGGNQGAPIDGGLGILLALGAGYGGLKFYKARKKKSIAEKQVE